MNLELIEKAIADSDLGEDCLGNRLYLDVNSEMVDWLIAELTEFDKVGMLDAAKRCIELANDCAAGYEVVAAIEREFKL